MTPTAHRSTWRPRALLLLALFLHLLGTAFAAPLHAAAADHLPLWAEATALQDEAPAHDEAGCAVCLGLHSPALPAVVGPVGAPTGISPAPAPPSHRPPASAAASARRARAPPLL